MNLENKIIKLVILDCYENYNWALMKECSKENYLGTNHVSNLLYSNPIGNISIIFRN